MASDLVGACLHEWQRRLIAELERSPLVEACYLTGGTALSGFYLAHRDSEDLDFFSDAEIPLAAIETFLDGITEIRSRRYQRLYDRKILLLDIGGQAAKIEFTRFPFPASGTRRQLPSGLHLDSLLDIYLNKLHAMTDRDEPKDDVDLYFILERGAVPPIARGAEMAEAKFQTRGLRYALQPRLLRVSRELPTTRPQVTADDVTTRLRAAARELALAGLEPEP